MVFNFFKKVKLFKLNFFAFVFVTPIILASCSAKSSVSFTIPDYQVANLMSKITQTPLNLQNQQLENDDESLVVNSGLVAIKQKSNSLIKINQSLISDFKKNYLIDTNLKVDSSKLKNKYPDLPLNKISFEINADDSFQANDDSTILNTAVVLSYHINSQVKINKTFFVPFMGFKPSQNQNFLKKMKADIAADSISLKPNVFKETTIFTFLKNYNQVVGQIQNSSKKNVLTEFWKKYFINTDLNQTKEVNNNKYTIKLHKLKLKQTSLNSIAVIANYVAIYYKGKEDPKIPTIRTRQNVYGKYNDVVNYQTTTNFTLKSPKIKSLSTSDQKTYQRQIKSYLEKATIINFTNLIDPLKYNFQTNNAPQLMANLPLTAVNKKDLEAVASLSVEKIIKNPNWHRSYIVTMKASFSDSLNPITYSKVFGVKKHAYIYDKSIQDNINNSHLFVPNLTREDLTQVPLTLTDQFGAGVLAGGYGENRKFYSENKEYNYIHLGEDVLAAPLTKIHAPFNGKIVAAFYTPSPGEAEGIGTTLILEVDRKDLDIDSNILNNQLKEVQKVYIGLIHLDTTSLTLLGPVTLQPQGKRNVEYASLITPQNPKTVKKGEVIGYVGQMGDNGGWAPHTHVSVVDATSDSYVDKNGFELKANSRLSTKRIMQYYSPAKLSNKFNYSAALSPGVQVWFGQSWSQVKQVNSSSVSIKDKNYLGANKKPLNFSGYLVKDYEQFYLSRKNFLSEQRLIDPNLLFNFRNQNSQVMVLNEIVPQISKASKLPKIDLRKQVVIS